MTKEMYTPPQIKIVEFGEEDVVVCSSMSGGIGVEGGIGNGDDGEDPWE